MGEEFNEEQLIERAKSGDDEAISRLLAPYDGPLLRYIHGIVKHSEDARDVFQETMLNAITGLKNYMHDGRFRAWLFRIAHNTAISHLRKRSRYTTATIDFDGQDRLAEIETEELDAFQQVIKSEDSAQLDAAIGKLLPVQREIILLRLVEELTFREIAEITDAPLNTVLGRMRKAVQRLRELLPEGNAAD